MNKFTMLRSLIMCILCAFMLASCNDEQKEVIIQQDVANLQSDAKQHAEPEHICVSSYSQENFLEPIEDYSWEREYPVEYVMLHFTSNVVNNRENPYVIDDVRSIFVSSGVSINYIVDRDGRILCYIPEDRVAWHAGRGNFADDEKYTNQMNKYSIGIEILAIGSQNDMEQYLLPHEYNALSKDFIGFTDKQYASLSVLVKDICERNNVPFDRAHIIGHDEYNPEKNDPGELFDWDRLFK